MAAALGKLMAVWTLVQHLQLGRPIYQGGRKKTPARHRPSLLSSLLEYRNQWKKSSKYQSLTEYEDTARYGQACSLIFSSDPG